MLGLATDGPRGLRLTERGKSLAVRTVPLSLVPVSSDMSELIMWNDTEEEPSEILELMLAHEPNLADGSRSP